jgi:sporulation protein YlmC with PRC-barrel domain
MNYLERVNHGRYKGGSGRSRPRLMGTKTLIGKNVYSQDDENVGTIKEIMLNMYTGEISYAVLSYEGLAVGTKLFAVPWEALTLDTVNKRFVLDVERSTLEDAPGFDIDNWPDTPDELWVAERINNSLWY